jgi:nicotinate-nucleotide pyrophosphorylase (carboxylating)
MAQEAFEELLEIAIREDLGEAGDVTSNAIFVDQRIKAVLTAKDSGVLAGEDYFQRVFKRLDAATSVEFTVHDGSRLEFGARIARVSGLARSVLAAERIAVNFLSFLSGIATMTRACVDAAETGGRAVILDTRKTLPGYRSLSKYAVLVGGGRNHRMGLFDMAIIKDNHIDAAGSITRAVGSVRAKTGDGFRIEVECRNAREVEEALACDVDMIMLDNMDGPSCRAAVDLGKGRVPFEASGNMTIARLPEYAGTGVGFISVGALTHSVKAFDFSLTVEKE